MLILRPISYISSITNFVHFIDTQKLYLACWAISYISSILTWIRYQKFSKHYIFHFDKRPGSKDIVQINFIFQRTLKTFIYILIDMMEKWDPVPGHFRPSGPSGTLRTLLNPKTPRHSENLPGTTNIPQDVMCEKDFSGIIILNDIFYIKDFSIMKIGFTKLVIISCWKKNTLKNYLEAF